MIIELTNFRCYANRTITIEDNAITLLNAPSGGGKTSIFKAINFALYGKEQKTTSFGQRKSKVKLTFNNLIITRTRTPNHLSVEVMEDDECVKRYEDTVAQAYIDDVFGAHFLQTCYLSQKALDNFFTISRDARAELLRSLSIQKFDINGLKGRNKAHVKERKTILTSSTAEYNFVKRDLDSRNFAASASVEPKFPLPLRENESYDDAIAVHKMQSENNNKKLLLATTALKEANLKVQGALNSSSHVEATKLELTSAENSITDITNKLEALKLIQTHDLSSKLSSLQQELEQAKLQMKLEDAESRLEKETELFAKSKAEKVDALQKKIKKLEGGRNIADEIADVQSEIDFCSKAKVAYKKITELASKLELKLSLSTNAFEDDCKAFLEESNESEDDESDESEKNHLQTNYVSQSLTDELATLQASLRDIDKQLTLEPQACPGCKTPLAVSEGHIHKFDSKKLAKTKKDLEAQIKVKKASLDKIREEIAEKEAYDRKVRDMCSTIEQYEEYLDNDVEGLDEVIAKDKAEIVELTKIQKDITTLKSELALVEKSKSDVVSYIQAEISTIKKKVKAAIVPTKNVEEYEKCITDVQVQLEAAKQQLNQTADLKIQKATLESRRKHLMSRLAEMDKLVATVDATKAEIKKIEEEIEDRSKKQQRFNKRIDEIEVWRNQYSIYSEWKRLNGKWAESKQKMDVAARALECALKFEKIITDVESEALQSFLDYLNSECEKHMSAMFGGEFSLKVRYEKTGDEDAKKYYVDVDVFKNAEEVPFDSLSGGESDRCALVLFLAFNKLGNGQMLLLDECLSSLHAESVEDIVEHIKSEFSDRTCVMTLHQTTKGIFDHIINI
jgi:DNA repair exonuclease SbcCD ATPase subunit